MEALSGWTLALLRLLSALHWSWTWTPARTDHPLANSYLNAAQRPLWILEDELMKRQRADRQEADYATNTRAPTLGRSARRHSWQEQQERQHLSTAITIRVRPDSEADAPLLVASPLAAPLTQRRFVLPHRLQIPSHYVQQLGGTPSKPRSAQRRRQPQSLPIFDSAPGDNALPTASYPIFVYNGTRGELLINTMLSAQRYPMQEPVPGQVLYPPSTPMFRPKPIVKRLKLPGQRELLNLTLIPFYAHEAITVMPTFETTTEAYMADADPDPAAAPATATAAEPLALTTPMPTPYETQLPRSKRKRKAKKAKQYSAYRSPQEVVQWQPPLRSSPALDPPDNHRHYVVPTTDRTDRAVQEQLEQLELLDAELEEPSQELQLEQQPPAQLEQTTSSSSSSGSSPSSFQIIYVDESMEAPHDSLDSTTEAPPLQRQSSRYALKREYYAFPVYTLGKLLQSPKPVQASHRARDIEIDCSGSSKEHGDNTWFIMNSRYRGPHRNGQKGSKEHTKYYTSKYVKSHAPR
ncbi:uncharacterized protein LOC115765095 [Drosophila novamexicana]|uniref:uncharacterized protein LOC115765095 n=1 Tax=Drosophila novamexicana TaxID=47314 RepID=UPI0011E5F74F|nr:uncharacterized protein LOC115765095 [Drosophila novamexicana]